MGANWEENLELVEVAALTLAGLTFPQINFNFCSKYGSQLELYLDLAKNMP